MQGMLIAALLIAQPGSDAYCTGLRQIVDSAPRGFAGAPAMLANPMAPEAPYLCSVVETPEPGDPVKTAHRDYVCETDLWKGALGDRVMVALNNHVRACSQYMRNVTTVDYRVATPDVLIDVGGTIIPGESRFGPPPATLVQWSLTVHARR